MCRLFGLHAGTDVCTATFWLLDAPDSLSVQSRRNPDGTGLGVFVRNNKELVQLGGDALKAALGPDAERVDFERQQLERRLRTRASDSEATIQRRLADAHADLAHAPEFDYLVVNDDFATALAQMREIVASRRENFALPAKDNSALLAQLLNSA